MMPTMCTSEHYELALIISGERQCITPDHVFFAHTGNIVTGMPHRLHQTSSSSDVPYIRILVKISISAADFIKQKIGSRTFDSLFDQHAHNVSEEGYHKIHSKFFEMLDEYNQYDKYSDTLLKDMLFHILTMLIRYEKLPEIQDDITLTSTNESIFKALLYIDSHFFDSPSMVEVASHVGLSTSYFSRLFKQITGKNYSAYLLTCKLQACRTQLLFTDHSIQEIADSLGMCNGNYLSNLFKKTYGESPREYRKRRRNGLR